jgi:sulfopyruvate decarboxylase subunit alpha
VVRASSRQPARSAPALPQQILARLKAQGIRLVASLPDQWLADLIRACESDAELRHVRLAREDDGVGLCAGAYLGGVRAALVCQNSALLLSANVLAAMAHHHQIPFLVLAAYRGSFDDGQYYQMYKGRVTEGVLRAIGVPYHVIDGPEHFDLIEHGARQALLSRVPLVLLLRRRALVAA